jgi:hypothetical protein
MQLMLCDSVPHMCNAARERLHQAQQSTAVQYMRMRSKGMPAQARQACVSSASVLSGGDWLRCADVSQDGGSLPAGLLALRVKPPLRLLGRDGVLSFDGSSSDCACSLLSPASDPLLDVFANVAPSDDPQVSYAPAVPLLSLVQFAARSFYHWMCEVLPRLVVAQAVWGKPSPATYNVLLPKSSTAFMTQSLHALGVASTIEFRNKLQLARAPLLFVTWNAQSLLPDKPAGFSLAHPHALRLLRSRLLEIVRLQQRHRPSVVVASRGEQTGMRNFDERALVNALSAALPSCDVVVANGSQPLLDNLALFASASAVVGVHGGALANIVACAAFTPVVEIGFPSEASWHYEHVAGALQLRYARVLADADQLHRSVGAATISCNVSAVAARLLQLMESKPASDASTSQADL